MTYNTSDDGSTWDGTESRLTNLYNVINPVSPDIIVAIEINISNTGTFLNKCLSSGYSKAAFIPNTSGYDQTNNGDDYNCNCLFYKSSEFSNVTHIVIPTYDSPRSAPSDTGNWRFRWTDRWELIQTGGNSLIIYAVHLKPDDWNGSSGGIYYYTGDQGVTDRATEISYLLYDIEHNLSSNDNFIVVGDFNTNSPSEGAYTSLLYNQGGYFHDPANDSPQHLTDNNWNATYWDPALSWSSRGLDYRFDMILVSANVWNGSKGVVYKTGSYTVDGNTNGSGPGSSSDLYLASDHLPVYATFNFTDNPSPVELVSFSAKVIDDNVNLTWNTATEVNNYGFDIERSFNNGVWHKIGFVNGNGTSNSPHNYNFQDNNLLTGEYIYRLKQIDIDGKIKYSETLIININSPLHYDLKQNYPNPFNPVTFIKYSLPSDGFVSLNVYDILGRKVANLVTRNQTAGNYSVRFDGSDLSSGLYIYQLKINDYVATKKLLLMK
jgi:hypothetical protein